MFDAATIDAIARAGGWVVAVIVLGGVVTAFIAGKLYAQKSMDREIKRGDMATAQIDRMTDNDERRQKQFDDLAGQLKVVIDVVTQVLGSKK